MSTGSPKLKRNRRGIVAPPDALFADLSLEVGEAGSEVDVECLPIQNQCRDGLRADLLRFGQAGLVGAEVHYLDVEPAQGQLRFSYKDYRQGNGHRTMSLSPLEFIRRFLLHVLPKGFVRIRHYGFLAHRSKKKKLALCRQLLGPTPSEPPPSHPLGRLGALPDHLPCPACQKGQMIRVKTLSPMMDWTEPRMNSPGSR